eukprot:Lithocolla_globosa_v1_NODE_5077_length_1309_cov_2.721691.p1 type:complete len:157 gc:universal NODE_5077_length_1309_cov_2.721691:945-475(-)
MKGFQHSQNNGTLMYHPVPVSPIDRKILDAKMTNVDPPLSPTMSLQKAVPIFDSILKNTPELKDTALLDLELSQHKGMTTDDVRSLRYNKTVNQLFEDVEYKSGKGGIHLLRAKGAQDKGKHGTLPVEHKNHLLFGPAPSTLRGRRPVTDVVEFSA